MSELHCQHFSESDKFAPARRGPLSLMAESTGQEDYD